ncbi:hypothetical protein CAEBREN_04830 [Caenorhabditis brenneri]|uniref:Uncharacterized protein n=1 Tax=Caenorhabditis brenneri TaxID=135651 RepID=G0MBC6_CAEBE|nr:hypothetical protein CAEBREN_04830 [Caenorhabditis brenneri]
MNRSILLLLPAFFLLAQSRNIPGNSAIDAIEQKDKPLRCWEEENGKYSLSDPKYPLCQYFESEGELFNVNGVDLESDDYTNILSMFGKSENGFAFLNVCLQEAYSFRGPLAQAAVSFRCLCKRDGCNVPARLDKFLEYNKLPLDLHHPNKDLQ